jgi:hypothetical protein
LQPFWQDDPSWRFASTFSSLAVVWLDKLQHFGWRDSQGGSDQQAQLEDSASSWAQGGIAAVLDNRDSIEAHIRDTITAGAFLNDPRATRFVIENGRRAVDWLIAQGVPFHAMTTATI